LNNQKILNIFCIHPISGSAILYRHLARILPLWANVVGVQYAFEADSLINKASSLGELAKYYAQKVRKLGSLLMEFIFILIDALGSFLPL